MISKKKGFTLAEVLVTLAIIGIVAALTIPSLINSTENEENIARAQKTYSTLTQAFNLAKQRNISFKYMRTKYQSSAQTYTKSYYDDFIAPYISVSNYCTTISLCNYTKLSSGTYFLQTNGQGYKDMTNSSERYTNFYMSDGTYVYMRFEPDIDRYKPFTIPTILFDVNGPKKPNRLGYDVFIAQVDDKEGVVPMCYDTPNEVDNNCSKTGSGKCCLYKLMKNGWKKSDNYIK